jgi:hypothetical protein
LEHHKFLLNEMIGMKQYLIHTNSSEKDKKES